jgi:hypothetical protein
MLVLLMGGIYKLRHCMKIGSDMLLGVDTNQTCSTQ